jgi:type IV secretion system protein VirD4
MENEANTLPHGLLLGWQESITSMRKIRTPIWDAAREGHLLTVGPTGSGKGVTSIIPALLTWDGPAIVIDPKGENYAVTAARRRAMGQRVYVLDPFGVTGIAKPDALNPFDLLGDLHTASTDNMRVVAHAVAQESAFGRNNDPFWNSRACTLITEAIRHCCRFLRKPTLADVRLIAETYDEQANTPRMRGEHTPCHPCSPISFNPPGMAMDRTKTSITSTAVDLLSFITEGPVEDSLSASTINLDAVKRGKPVTIYIVVPPHKLTTHAKLMRLWLITLLNTITERRIVPRIPTLFILDETAQLGEMKQLASAIAVMRGYGMRLWTFWQDINQLRATYPTNHESILANSTFSQYYFTSVPGVSSAVAHHLRMTSNNEFHKLQPHESVLFVPGKHGVVVSKPNYLKDVLFEGLYDENPFHRQIPAADEEDQPFDDKPDGATILRFPKREAGDV